ncbi:hypothetical protein PV326_010445, partial [Microctonus aethiopoides]
NKSSQKLFGAGEYRYSGPNKEPINAPYEQAITMEFDTLYLFYHSPLHCYWCLPLTTIEPLIPSPLNKTPSPRSSTAKKGTSIIADYTNNFDNVTSFPKFTRNKNECDDNDGNIRGNVSNLGSNKKEFTNSNTY